MGCPGRLPPALPAMEAPETVPPRTSPPEPPRPGDDANGPVPLFGSWRAIHGAVIACALAVMALVALFSRWPF